jgi:thymidylate synthase (FAD)
VLVKATEIRPSVRLISSTPDPELAVARAARLCYSPSGLAGIEDRMTHEQAVAFIRKLREIGHLSPFEHASFQFYIEGSRAMLAQLTRHRIASYSVQSLRYVKPDRPEYVVPPRVRDDPGLSGIYAAQMAQAFQAYQDLMSRGVAAEDARMVLGQGVATRLVCTFNARSLHNFFRLRCCRRAQWEIRQIAYQMKREVQRVAPALFDPAGSACETDGRCPEGRMSCGRVKYLRRGKGEGD